MATVTSPQRKAQSSRPSGKKKEKSVEITPRESRFTFEDYVINEFRELKNEIRELRTETKNEIRELRSETKSDIKELRTDMGNLKRWVFISGLTLLFGLLGLMTFFHNKNSEAIKENTKVIHKIDKKFDRLEIEMKSGFKEILKRLPSE